MQSQVQGGLRPLVMQFMRLNLKLHMELSFEDRYVDLVEQGIDVAVRTGRLADSKPGARFLRVNPWLVVAAPEYLAERGTPQVPAELGTHDALIDSTMQGDARWHFIGADGQTLSQPVTGPLRSNSLLALLGAARGSMGVAALPWYVAFESVRSGAVVHILADWSLPSQEIHAVYPRSIPYRGSCRPKSAASSAGCRAISRTSGGSTPSEPRRGRTGPCRTIQHIPPIQCLLTFEAVARYAGRPKVSRHKGLHKPTVTVH